MQTFLTNLMAALTAHFSAWRVVAVAQSEPASSKTIIVRPSKMGARWSGIDTNDATYRVEVIFYSQKLTDVTGVDLAAFILAYPEVTGGYRIRMEDEAEYHSGLNKEEYGHELVAILTADSR